MMLVLFLTGYVILIMLCYVMFYFLFILCFRVKYIVLFKVFLILFANDKRGEDVRCISIPSSNIARSNKISNTLIQGSRGSIDQREVNIVRGSIDKREVNIVKGAKIIKFSTGCHHQKGGECEVKLLNIFDEDKL